MIKVLAIVCLIPTDLRNTTQCWHTYIVFYEYSVFQVVRYCILSVNHPQFSCIDVILR